ATASGAMVRNRGRHQRVLSHPGCMRSGAPGSDLREGPQLNSSRSSLIGEPQGLSKRHAPAHPRTRQIRKEQTMKTTQRLSLGLLAVLAAAMVTAVPAAAQQQKKPNVVMLMTDDTGWNDFGAYSGGGAALGHPTPNIDRIAKEGAVFTNWYGQASCTAGRASFMTGRIPIRSALSIVVAPGDPNALKKETPTIAEFFKKNGYSTYFSGKWHLGDK